MDDKLTVSQESSDQMDLVYAFLTARYKDDEEAAMMLLNADEEGCPDSEAIAMLVLGLSDMCLAQMRMMAALTGATMDEFLQAMGLVKAVHMTVED